MRKIDFPKYFVLVFLLLFFWGSENVQAEQDVIRLNATVIIASNQGTDFNLDNDAFRDELIKLFSYTNYQQVDIQALNLPRSERIRLKLPEGYELVLTLQEEFEERIDLQALVRRYGRQYVYTILSLQKPGMVFLGGPPMEEGGDLIIVLENTGN